jgi:hypothetical protein
MTQFELQMSAFQSHFPSPLETVVTITILIVTPNSHFDEITLTISIVIVTNSRDIALAVFRPKTAKLASF